MIQYKLLKDSEYVYELEDMYSFKLDDLKGIEQAEGFLSINTEGNIIVNKGYAWDGPSGPVIHTVSWVRASLIHDVLYQMLRMKWLPQSYRKKADNLMYKLAVEDGMPKWRAWYSWVMVRLFGGKYAK